MEKSLSTPAFKEINISAAVRPISYKLWPQLKLQYTALRNSSPGWPPGSKGAGQPIKCIKTKFKQASHQRLARHRNHIKTCAA